MSTYPIERRANTPAPHEPAPGDLFGLRSAVDTVLRRGALALTVFGLVMAAAVNYAFVAAPVYRADTLVRLDSRVRESMAPNQGGGDRTSAEPERPNTAGEIEILNSREVLLPVIAQTGADIELDRARRFHFLPVGARHGVRVTRFQVPPSAKGKAFGLEVAGERWTLADNTGVQVAQGTVGVETPFETTRGGGVILVQAKPGQPAIHLRLQQLQPLKAHESVVNRLKVLELARESGVLRLTYEDEDPQRAADLLNAMVSGYLAHTIARKADDGTRTRAFLEDQLPAARAKVEAAERALASYQQTAHAAPLNSESDALLRQRTELERQAVDLQIKNDQLAQHLTPAHPELAAVMRQQSSVRAALARLDQQADRLPEQSREVQRLQRELQAQNQAYGVLRTQVQQLRVAQAGWLPNGRQLDRAMVPVERARPRTAAVLSVGAGLGLVLALLATLAAQALQPTVTGGHDLLSRAMPPTLAVIPESASQKRLMSGRLPDGSLDEIGTHRLLARAAPDEAAIESLRSVHLSLMLRERQQPNKVILITSPSSGTGKTFVAANLAAVIAESGRRVLLIDADLQKPGVHRIVAIDERAAGLTDLLNGTSGIDQVIHTHPSAGFDVMLHGSQSSKLGSVLLSPMLEDVMVELRQRYDHIVINSAPVAPSRDALVVGRHADMALMVLRAEQSRLAETRQALRRLEQAGIALEGLLFNGVKRNRLVAPIVS